MRPGNRADPGEIDIEVIERETARAEPPPGSGSPRRTALLVLVAVLVVVVVYAVATGDGDGADPDERDGTDRDDESALDPPGGSAATRTGDALSVIATALEAGRVEVRASWASGGSTPWVEAELCGNRTVACIPVWPDRVDQSDAVTVVDLVIAPVFSSAGGVEHDCRVAGCSLRIHVPGDSVALPLPQNSAVFSGGAESVDAGDLDGLEATPGDDGLVTLRVAGRAGERFAVRVCPPDDGSCAAVHTGRTDDAGVSTVRIRPPRVLLSRAGAVWREWDCATVTCTIVVEGAAGRGATPLPGDDSGAPGPTIAIAPEADGVLAGDTVVVTGEGFVAPRADRAAGATWLLCEVRPAALWEIPTVCGTPRVVVNPTISPDGTFSQAVRVPDPAGVRTWDGNRPLACADPCWLGAVSSAYGEVAWAPVRIEGP